MHRAAFVLLAALAMLAAASQVNAEEKKPVIRFNRTQLDAKFRSEGAAVGDFNHDGKLDIAAGYVYYAAPDWTLTPITDKAPEYDPMVYSNSFCNFAEDLDKDGWTDIIVVDFPGAETWWFQNPQTSGGPWKRHTCVKITNNESPNYLDIDGDGKRELILGSAMKSGKFDGPDRQMGFARPGSDPTALWTFHAISTAAAPGSDRFSHGLGVGDMDKDGKNDILVPAGWWKAPADLTGGEWEFHKAALGENCANMYVDDFDGDGDSDVVSSAAHKTGIWWHERTKDGWKTHLISDAFSQTHAMCYADMDGDGDMDFITGKRWWAHGPKGDDNPNEPAVIYWFEFSRTANGPQWTPRLVDGDSGVGTQFEVADVNGDGLLDVVTANKKGANLLLQVRE